MAACTELEIEGKSSEESSCNALQTNDVAFQENNSKSRCSAVCTSKSQGKLNTQQKVESETGDLKELSDDEFLHLLKEASTFNKPNDQESILLQQLRKEVADADSCEQVRCSESSCVTKRTDLNSSKLSCGTLQKTVDTSANRIVINTHNSSNISSTSLPSRTFESFSKNEKESIDFEKEPSKSKGQMFSSSKDGVTVIEIDPTNHQWPKKTCETDSQLVLEPHKTLCNNKLDEQMSPGVSIETNRDSKSFNNCDKSFNNAKSQLGALPVEFKLEVDPLPTLLIGNYQNFGEVRVPSKNIPVSQQNSNESPAIELTEFKRTKEKDVKDGDQKTIDASTSKSQINNQLSSSKFYVNCNDVDTTVTFPLKLVPSMDDKNGGGLVYDALSEQMKHRMAFPCFPWPRPQQVHSFLNDDPQSQSENENSGNPFMRGARTANITSFVSATLLDYPSTALIPDTPSSKLEWTHRKHKRTRNHTESNTFILSQNIEGHRGNEDIDSLVKFIEAADKNDKAFHRGNMTNNHMLPNKTTQESLKKKINGKEIKNQKNCCLPRKKLSQSNSEENYKQDSLDNKNANSESECSDDSSCNKKKLNSKYSENAPLLDINSNIMEADQTFLLTSEISNSIPVDSGIENSSSARSISPDAASFSNDFYPVSEAAPPTTEESGFCIVRKKQRKKHQMKRSDNYRWHSAAARVRQSTSGDNDYYSKEQSQHGSDIILLPGSLVQRGQCGKQDSRRKSTSSVPQSEQSSADNSDLDSVHSLPVRGSAPHPTQPHPHTTPSSSSSTPQASYADIAKMPISSASKLNSSNNGNFVSKANNTDKPSVPISHNVDKEIESAPNSRKQSIINGEICCASANRLTREINTQTEPLVENNSEKLDSSIDENKACSMCSVPVKSKLCTCSKLHRHVNSKKENSESGQRPAVLMMGNVPTTEASDISFGIDFAEILQISSTDGNCSEDNNAHASVNCSDNVDYKFPCTLHHSNGCNCRVSDAAKSSSSSGDVCKVDLNKQLTLALRKKMSSPCNELTLSSGQKLCYVDKGINAKTFNCTQLVDHLNREWMAVMSEYSSDTNKTQQKVRYYDEDNC